MLTKTVDIRTTQTPLEELLSLALTGTEIIFTESGAPIARLAPVASSTTSRVAGLQAGAICMSDDFNEPLPEEFWTGDK